MLLSDLSFDCLYNIILHTEDFDIFRLIQINNQFYSCISKPKLWERLWIEKYKDNDLADTLDMYGNFLRCTLVKKFIQLNFKLLKCHYGKHILHSGTPKRNLDRAMFIPMIGYNYSEHPHCNTKNLPKSLRRAFKRVGLNLPELPLDSHGKGVEFANDLLKSGQLMMKPKKGDIMTFCETAWDYGSCLMLYDGKEIDYFSYDKWSNLSDMSWPAGPIDYWEHEALIPCWFQSEFKKNIVFGKVPLDIDNYRTDVYSFVKYNEKVLYVFFEEESNLDDFDECWDWSNDGDFTSVEYKLFSRFGKVGDLEYLLFIVPDC